jgi:hypothetical protein
MKRKEYLWLMINDSRFMVKNVLKALWQFCSYVFWPQRRQHPEDVGFTETRIYGNTDFRRCIEMMERGY